MHSAEELLDIINKALASENFKKQPEELYKPVEYILSLGGKRLRPVLLMMACEMFGGDIKRAIPAALGVEMFHNFSLVHDDIMDRAPLRRGKPTVHEKWNANIAILSGDTMLTMAYDFFLRLEGVDHRLALEVFGNTAREVCEGQQIDMNFETRENISPDEYFKMIRLKTAVLIGASLKIGGISANAGIDDLDRLYESGIVSGLQFQLIDDLLDTYGDEKVFGKMHSGDITANKKTILYVDAMLTAGEQDRQRLSCLYSGKVTDIENKIYEVKAIFDRLGVKELVEKRIRDLHLQSRNIMDSISVDPEKKKILIDYTEKLLERKN